jgi:hypothetical protein
VEAWLVVVRACGRLASEPILGVSLALALTPAVLLLSWAAFRASERMLAGAVARPVAAAGSR